MRVLPDIVFIILDTQRVDRMSCYGYGKETTPHLDKFSVGATLYTRAIAPAQWTVPAHASMFTGLYPSQHGLRQMTSVLSGATLTLAERLSHAGYYTAGFSHNPLIGTIKNGLQRGFNQFTNYSYPGTGLLSVRMGQLNTSASSMKKLRHFVRFMLAESLGFSQQTSLSNISSITLPLWQKVIAILQKDKPANVARSLTAVSELLVNRKSVEPNQPIFAFINLMGTHVPYAPPLGAIKRFLPDTTSQSAASQLLQKANNWQVDVRNWLKMELSENEYKTGLNGVYNAEVYEQDAQIGRFFASLRTSGAFDNTLVIITADHGDHLGEKQRLNHAFGVYKQLTHVPLIIRDPSDTFRQGNMVNSLVSTRRIFHTLLTAVGAATREESELTLASGKEREPVFTEGYPLDWAIKRLEQYRPVLGKSAECTQPARAIYTDSFKLIRVGEQHFLYDIAQDTDEVHDLSQKFPERTVQMQVQLDKFIQQNGLNIPEIGQQEVEDEIVLQQLRMLGYIE